MEERMRVVVADDQDLVRSGFKLILMSYDGIDVVGERATATKRWNWLRGCIPTWCSWISACRA